MLVTSSVDEKLSVTADSGMSRNAEMRPRAGARSPECGSGSGDGTSEIMTETILLCNEMSRPRHSILTITETSCDMIG